MRSLAAARMHISTAFAHPRPPPCPSVCAPARDRRDAVVASEIAIHRSQSGLVGIGLGHQRSGVTGHRDLEYSAEGDERSMLAIEPVRRGLVGIGVSEDRVRPPLRSPSPRTGTVAAPCPAHSLLARAGRGVCACLWGEGTATTPSDGSASAAVPPHSRRRPPTNSETSSGSIFKCNTPDHVGCCDEPTVFASER